MSAAFGTVFVLVEPTRRYWRLVVTSCPACGRPHHHGGGLIDEAPILGLRALPCRRGVYRLVAAMSAKADFSRSDHPGGQNPASRSVIGCPLPFSHLSGCKDESREFL